MSNPVDPITGQPITPTDPTPLPSGPTSTAPSPKDQLLSLVNDYESDLDALSKAHDASTAAQVAAATANAQVTSTAQAVTDAQGTVKDGLASLKSYVNSLADDGTPTPASAAALQA